MRRSLARLIRVLSLVIRFLVAGAMPVRAAVITFDDLPSTASGLQVPNGYGGLDFDNLYYLNGVHYELNPSGYQTGVISAENVALNWFADPAMIISSDAPFTFTGAYLTAAWNDGLSVRVQGFTDGAEVYDTTVHPSATVPTFFTFDYESIDELLFSSFGGFGHPGYLGGGTHFAMDNFTYRFAPIPEPSAGVLLVGGLLGLAGWRKVRRSA